MENSLTKNEEVMIEQNKQDIPEKSKEKKSELTDADKALLEKFQEKTNVLRILAHDLKNPVSALKGSALLIYNDPEDVESNRELSKLIIDAADEVIGTLKQFLDFSEIDDVQYELNLRDVNINKMLDKIVEANKPQARTKNQILSLKNYCSSDIITKADEQKLLAAVDNIVNNAIKYSPQYKPIEVSVKNGSGSFRIEIKDEGPGFSEEDLKNVFSKFQRLSAKPTGGELSSGLGLFIVKKIIELHKGSVWIESQPGAGSKFIIQMNY